MHRNITGWAAPVAALLVATACQERGAIDPNLNADLGAGVSSSQNTYSGRATVVQASILGINTVLVDAGPLPSSGGADEATLLSVQVPGVLSGEVAHASTVGQGDASRSEAAVARTSITVGGNSIAADFVMARAEARCVNGTPVLSGSSQIERLVVNGGQVVISGDPNQTVSLPTGGTIVINEQVQTSNAITVNALHVTQSGAADVIVSSAHADITCDPTCPPAYGDFVTGGGWITVNGANANFGVAGGLMQNGSLWGHLTYVDHGSGLTVLGTGVTAYEVVDATTRRIKGTAEINGQPGNYEVEVSDKGEPSTSDSFRISLSTGYSASGTLDGGNIQLHPQPAPCP